MQKQKTIAKWLAIILLCTLALGAYIIYDTLYSGQGSGNSQAATDENDGGNDDDVTPPPREPYYSTLPREPESIGELSVAHTGGEAADEFAAAVVWGENTLVFFNTFSTEFDCREAGAAVSLFRDGTLIKNTTFAPAPSKTVCAKLTSEGAAALVSGPDAARLYLLSQDGDIRADAEFPVFDEAKMYLWNKTLWVFYISGGVMRAASVSSGFDVLPSAYRTDCEGKIVEIFARSDSATLVVQYSDGDLGLIEFAQNKGFTSLLRLDKLAFIQLAFMRDGSENLYALLGAREGYPVMITLSDDFKPVAQTAVEEDAVSGALFTRNNEIRLVTPLKTRVYCKHLDLLDTLPSGAGLDNFLAARSFGGDDIILGMKDGTVTLIKRRSATDESFQQICEFSQTAGRAELMLSGTAAILLFSSSSNRDAARMNFGGSDVFMVKAPLG